jgi:hypothetical protein
VVKAPPPVPCTPPQWADDTDDPEEGGSRLPPDLDDYIAEELSQFEALQGASNIACSRQKAERMLKALRVTVPELVYAGPADPEAEQQWAKGELRAATYRMHAMQDAHARETAAQEAQLSSLSAEVGDLREKLAAARAKARDSAANSVALDEHQGLEIKYKAVVEKNAFLKTMRGLKTAECMKTEQSEWDKWEEDLEDMGGEGHSRGAGAGGGGGGGGGEASVAAQRDLGVLRGRNAGLVQMNSEYKQITVQQQQELDKLHKQLDKLRSENGRLQQKSTVVGSELAAVQQSHAHEYAQRMQALDAYAGNLKEYAAKLRVSAAEVTDAQARTAQLADSTVNSRKALDHSAVVLTTELTQLGEFEDAAEAERQRLRDAAEQLFQRAGQYGANAEAMGKYAKDMKGAHDDAFARMQERANMDKMRRLQRQMDRDAEAQARREQMARLAAHDKLEDLALEEIALFGIFNDINTNGGAALDFGEVGGVHLPLASLRCVTIPRCRVCTVESALSSLRTVSSGVCTCQTTGSRSNRGNIEPIILPPK